MKRQTKMQRHSLRAGPSGRAGRGASIVAVLGCGAYHTLRTASRHHPRPARRDLAISAELPSRYSAQARDRSMRVPQHHVLASDAPPATGRPAKLLAWSQRPAGAIGVALALLAIGGALAPLPAMRNFDLALLDAKFALLSSYAPLPAADSIAIVGIDEPSLDALAQPQSLLLRPLADALTGIAAA